MRYLFSIALLLISTPCFAVVARTYTICEGGGCDYTTLAGAESARQQDLTSTDSTFTFEIQNTWASADGTATIIGWTADATRFLTVVTVGAARHSGTYSTSAYRIETTGSGTHLNVTEAYTVIDGLQISTTYSGSNGATLLNVPGSSGHTNRTIINNIVRGNGGAETRGIQVSNTFSAGEVVRNNIVYDCGSAGIDIVASAGGCKADNNTVENCATGIVTGNNDAIIRNNIVWNCTTPLSGNFNTTTLSEEQYTDASSLSYGSCGSCGTGDQVSQSDPFVSLAGENYHLAASVAAIDAGKDLSGDFTTDIDGDTRDSNFDKGADEFIASATGQKVMIRK